VSASNIITTSAIPTDLLFFIANPPIREPRMLHDPAIYSFSPTTARTLIRYMA
jgi:hypothetical protein